MVTVDGRRAVSARPTAQRHKQIANGSKPSYRVVLEQVTQKKKRLITVGSAEVQPPPGYTLIPAGDPQITSRCKHLARLDGCKVFVVSTTRHKIGLSQQVHRIGHHFPSSIVGRACLSLGIDLSRSGHVLRQHEFWRPESLRRKTGTQNGGPKVDGSKASQAIVDTQAREAIKDLFPKIPEHNMHEIIKHAFELGTERVGTATELPVARRVQLAVVAHIRHAYTDYDKLLRQVPYQAARAMVEQATLDKFVEWRGENDDDANAMEEILQEVIVIPDEDDEDDDQNASLTEARRKRRDQVEVIDSPVLAKNMELKSIDYGQRSGAYDLASSSESDDQDVTFLGNGQYAFDKRDSGKSARDGARRRLAWEQARIRQKLPRDGPRGPDPAKLSTMESSAVSNGLIGSYSQSLRAEAATLESSSGRLERRESMRPSYVSGGEITHEQRPESFSFIRSRANPASPTFKGRLVQSPHEEGEFSPRTLPGHKSDLRGNFPDRLHQAPSGNVFLVEYPKLEARSSYLVGQGAIVPSVEHSPRKNSFSPHQTSYRRRSDMPWLNESAVSSHSILKRSRLQERGVAYPRFENPRDLRRSLLIPARQGQADEAGSLHSTVVDYSPTSTSSQHLRLDSQISPSHKSRPAKLYIPTRTTGPVYVNSPRSEASPMQRTVIQALPPTQYFLPSVPEQYDHPPSQRHSIDGQYDLRPRHASLSEGRPIPPASLVPILNLSEASQRSREEGRVGKVQQPMLLGQNRSQSQVVSSEASPRYQARQPQNWDAGKVYHPTIHPLTLGSQDPIRSDHVYTTASSSILTEPRYYHLNSRIEQPVELLRMEHPHEHHRRMLSQPGRPRLFTTYTGREIIELE